MEKQKIIPYLVFFKIEESKSVKDEDCYIREENKSEVSLEETKNELVRTTNPNIIMLKQSLIKQ